MQTYRAALIGCGRMGAFIDNEVAGRSNLVLPYSHAAGYEACPRTDLVAGADMRPDVLAAFGTRYGVAADQCYTDYRALIERERPDIVSIATQPADRAAVAIFAMEHGARALYCEKPLCASVAEAATLAAVAARYGVVVNMGTNRRWHPGFAAMRAAINSGEYGALTTLTTWFRSRLFNTGSHWVDLLCFLNGDTPVSWVQAHLPDGATAIAGDTVISDPYVQGTLAFSNGVMAHLLGATRPGPHRAACERAELVATDGDARFEVWADAAGAAAPRLLAYQPASATLRLIEDLVHVLDTGAPVQGGIDVAVANTQILFGLVESERRGGARVALPLPANDVRFAPADSAPRQPKYAA